MHNDVIIIGGGQAGLSTAISLRRLKYKGGITIIGAENHLPYQRPPLSKGFLANEIQEKNLYLKSQSFFENNNIKFQQNKAVLHINRNKKTILVDDKTEMLYKTLVITTGSDLHKLDLSCSQLNLHYLRTVDNSMQIKLTLDCKKNIVVVGGGYIGLEIASVAIKKGVRVTVIEQENKIMSRSVSKETSTFYQKKHEAMGVKFKLNTFVQDINDYKDKKQVICSDGTIINTDAVIVGIGIKPNIKLALDAGLECNNGILVNENGQTSDRNIFSAGDCTNHPNNIYNRRLRLESVHNAVEQAKSVAAAISGVMKPYNQVPWFWSDQYNTKLQIIGISTDYDQYVVRGKIKKETFSIIYLKNNRIIALDAINDQKSFLIGKKLISLKIQSSSEILSNENIALKELLNYS